MEENVTYKTDISLYDLGGQDWYVYINKSVERRGDKTRKVYDLILTNDDEDEEVNLKDMHPVALESLARTCRQLLSQIKGLGLYTGD